MVHLLCLQIQCPHQYTSTTYGFQRNIHTWYLGRSYSIQKKNNDQNEKESTIPSNVHSRPLQWKENK